MTEDTGARLEKIQGGVDLINERLKHANELQNERHEQIRSDIARLDLVDAALDGRVVVLEARDNVMVGERQGIGLAAKVLPFLFGGAAAAVVGLILRAAGV